VALDAAEVLDDARERRRDDGLVEGAEEEGEEDADERERAVARRQRGGGGQGGRGCGGTKATPPNARGAAGIPAACGGTGDSAEAHRALPPRVRTVLTRGAPGGPP